MSVQNSFAAAKSATGSPFSTKTAPPTRKLSAQLIRYELVSLIGNWYIPFFGLAFPILMGQLIARVAFKDIPEAFYREVVTSFCFTMLQLVPLASVFLGHASIFSQELEKKVPLRLQLFGINFKVLLQAKLCAFACFITLAMAICFGINALSFPILKPTLSGAVITFFIYYLLSAVLFLFAHGIANLLQRFGPTYGVSMSLYFFFMIIGNMMGVRYDDFPPMIRKIAELLPFTYISTEMHKIWTGQAYNFAPMIQSFIFLAALAVGTVVWSVYYRKSRPL